MTNTMNTPIEALPLAYPFTVERYEIREGTGGAGPLALDLDLRVLPGHRGVRTDLPLQRLLMLHDVLHERDELLVAHLIDVRRANAECVQVASLVGRGQVLPDRRRVGATGSCRQSDLHRARTDDVTGTLLGERARV